MTTVLGLTGGIASGKSTVSNFFKDKQIPVVDADIVARDVMRAGQPVVAEIAEIFGQDYILENGEIDRAKLGKAIFTYEEKRKQLNQIVQGEIRKEIIRQQEAFLTEKHPLIVLDIPLLYEGQYETVVDTVMVVYVNPKTQHERLLKRNPELSDEDVKNRIGSQMSLEEKAQRADILIDNNGTVAETIAQVEEWLAQKFPELKET